MIRNAGTGLPHATRRAIAAAAVQALLLFAATSAAHAAPPTPVLRDLVAATGGDPAKAGGERYTYLNKLDGRVQELAAGKRIGTGAVFEGGVAPGGRVLVDVYVNGDVSVAAQRLRALGMDVTAVSRREPERMVEGYLPSAAAPKVAALDSTKSVLSITGSGTDTGSVTSQGDAAAHGPQARSLGPTGAGVTVGVMSDSINDVGGGIAGSQGTGDLPATVTDLGDAPSGTDEGRAMAEVIYDEAPGITHMIFDTGTTGAATKAAHIDALVSAGASVIADDSFYLNEPFFQDGTVSQAVDRAAANGTAYIAAAGNHARESWEGRFTPVGNLNDFGGGDTRQAVVDIPAHSSMMINLQWDEPWGSAPTNFDINILANNVPVFSCTSNTGFPVESCGVATGGSSSEVEIEIVRQSGSGTPPMKYIVQDSFGAFTIKEHATNSSSINPDAAAAKGALAAGAVCWSTTIGNCTGAAGLQSPEIFSSRGPVTRSRDASGNPLSASDVRQKPNVAAADGVSTTVPGFAPFFGTSAAAASAAGVATLARSAHPGLTVAQLYTILTDPGASLDCTSASGDPDTDCGSGFLQADRVVSEALDTSPPVIADALSPAAPEGAHGWYHSPVNVTWNVSDPQSPITQRSGCDPASVSTDTVASFTCQATSIGGMGSESVTIKRDASPPTTPQITGITARTYAPSSLPHGSAIHCTAGDPTSGVDGCTIAGYGTAFGTHRLTAIATDDAGLTSINQLSYTVGCKVPTLKGQTLVKATKALEAAGCALGKVKPKRHKGKFVVKSSTPRAGTLHKPGTKVSLTLTRKHR